MLIFAFVIALTSVAVNGTYTYQECETIEFKGRVCRNARHMKNAGKFLCSIQGKGHDNHNCTEQK